MTKQEQTSKSYTAGNLTNSSLNQGENITSHVNINHAPDSTSVEVVKEIQELIAQLSQTYPNPSTVEQMKIATQAIERIDNDPKWKQQVIKAFQAGVLESLKTNAIGAFVVGAIEEWSRKPKNS